MEVQFAALQSVGRITIPTSIRENFKIKHNDSIEIYTEGEQIILKKYEPTCVFCATNWQMVNFKGRCICKNCLRDLRGEEKNGANNVSNSIYDSMFASWH